MCSFAHQCYIEPAQTLHAVQWLGWCIAKFAGTFLHCEVVASRRNCGASVWLAVELPRDVQRVYEACRWNRMTTALVISCWRVLDYTLLSWLFSLLSSFNIVFRWLEWYKSICYRYRYYLIFLDDNALFSPTSEETIAPLYDGLRVTSRYKSSVLLLLFVIPQVV